jgi:isocitrate/isopropylmalate dehydrogenase
MVMKKYNIAIIPGDGIGTEIIDATRNVLKVIGSKNDLEFEFKEFQAGEEYAYACFLGNT